MADQSGSSENRLLSPLRAFDARINGWAQEITSWQGLFIGAVTVALGQGLADAVPFSEFYSTLALFPITLALLSAQLFLAARYTDGTGGAC